MLFRFAETADAVPIAAIYGPFVDGVTSFEATAPSPAEMEDRMRAVAADGLPWIVADDNGVVGYAYATLHRKRAAYAWTVETSVYLDPCASGKGLGTALMRAMLALLEAQGHHLVLAGVTLPNPASLALHRKLGFADIGVYPSTGFKSGAWHDVWWGGLRLGSPSAPVPPRPISSLAPEQISSAGIGSRPGVSE